MNKQIEIILEVSKEVMGDTFINKKRYRDYVFKRAVYYKCCKQLSNESTPGIGNSIGKDHATVIHGLKIFELDILERKNETYLKYYRDIIRFSAIRLNKRITELMDSKELMMHTIINQRGRIKQLEELLHNIRESVKMKYA